MVKAYKHLGALAAASCPLGQEIAARTSSAGVACSALCRPLLGKTVFPAKTRVAVASACIHTRCNYLAGTWPLLSAPQQKRYDAAMMRPLRIICGAHRPPAEGQRHTHNVEILEELLVVPPAWALVFQRLKMAVRTSRTAPEYVLAMIQGKGGQAWREAISASLAALKALLPAKLADLPSPLLDPCAWEASWMAAPGMWFQLFAAAERAAAKKPAAALRLLFATPGFVPSGLDCNGAEQDEFLCGLCAATFSTPGGVATHRLKTHPISAPEPQLLRDSVIGCFCPVCGQDFRHRLRVLHHLRARPGAAGLCREEVLSGRFLGLHTAEQVAAADEADRLHRRVCRRAGIHILAGPAAR